jgi:hypothetical protein
MPTVPDFASRQWQRTRDAAQMTASILDGKGALMPAWRGRLSVEQARELTAFVRTLDPAGSAGGATPESDFRRRFDALQKQWEELDRQVRSFDRPANAVSR